MISRLRTVFFLVICLPCFFISCDKDDDPDSGITIDFQNITFSGDALYNNNAGGGAFVPPGQNIVSLSNFYSYSEEYGDYWEGFSYSKMDDMETRGRDNQYSVYAKDNPEGNIFAVFFETGEITFTQPVKNLSFDIANSTYAYWSMKEGDGFIDAFTTDDWFELTMTITTESGETEPKTFKLADGTTLTDQWKKISFGEKDIVKIKFSLSSTDILILNGEEYMNNPGYFCLDNIKFETLE